MCAYVQMDILACAHLAFGQSNLRNKWLLENAPVRGSCASRGSHDFSLFSAGYVGVSHTISWGKCQSNLLPRDMPLAHKDTTELPSTSHRVQQLSTKPLLVDPPERERHVAQHGTPRSHGQMPVPITWLTASSQGSVLIMVSCLSNSLF